MTAARAASKKATPGPAGASGASRSSGAESGDSTRARSGTRRRRTGPTLAVRSDEEPWTDAELAEIRAEIEHDIRRAVEDLQIAEVDLRGLIQDGGDGSGDDQADAGAKTYEREQEISVANISRDKLAQNRHALERLDNGSYGICESCGEPIGKFRLQAAPRATLCRACKERAERV